MKTHIRKALASVSIIAAAVALTVSGASQANADIEKPAYQCALGFKAKGTDIQILLGHSRLSGEGVISCIDVAGNTERIPVRVTFKTPLLFPRISFAPHVAIKGLATGIGLTEGPRSLLGSYLAIDVKAAVGVGLGTAIALHGNNGLTLNVSLEGVKGLGFAAGATVAEIEEL